MSTAGLDGVASLAKSDRFSVKEGGSPRTPLQPPRYPPRDPDRTPPPGGSMLNALLARKAIDADADQGLQRTLKGRDLLLLGVGATIGAGLFSLTGIVAADYAGPAVVVSLLVARDRLRADRPLLRRDGGDGALRRLGLRLRLRRARRIRRLDHRLGPLDGIRDRRRHGRLVVVELCALAVAGFRLAPAGLFEQGSRQGRLHRRAGGAGPSLS